MVRTKEQLRQYQQQWVATHKEDHAQFVKNLQMKKVAIVTEYKKQRGCDMCGTKDAHMLRFTASKDVVSVSKLAHTGITLELLTEDMNRRELLCMVCVKSKKKDRAKNYDLVRRSKISESLGTTSLGAASNRLRKSIMFHMAQKLQWDICYRCGLKIERVEEFSIEHKLPWEGNDPALFWDMENIAFSHLGCNIGAATKKNKIIAPDGQQWCTGCKDFHDVGAFGNCNVSGANRNGKQRMCRVFSSAQRAEYRSRTGKR